ncbi:PAS domain-containing protein [Altererythrobacter sp.]|nr:PAS domain-containing protein [Altererythrobacter sp.]
MNDPSHSIWPQGTLPAAEFCDETVRLDVLSSFGIEQLQDDPELNRIAIFAAQLCQAPTALVSIVEKDRQCFLAHKGLDITETPKDVSFCQHAMLGHSAMIIHDTKKDPGFRDNPLVTGDPFIRFYAGMPLITSEGAPIGTLCIIDREPRADGLTELQLEGLSVLAQAAMRRLEARRQSDRSLRDLTESEARLRFMLDSVPDIAWSAHPGPVFDQFNARWSDITGAATPAEVADWEQFIHPDDWAATSEKFADSVARAEPYEDQWRLKLADGTYRWVLSRAVPTHDDPATARWFGTLTDIDDSYRRGEQRELLADELAHRIKNIFAVVNGLISLRSRDKPEAKTFASELAETIHALGRAQDFVRPLTDTKGDSLHGLLDVLTAPYGKDDTPQVHVTGDVVNIGIRAATPMALIFHELATNSAKYGALSVAEGRIDVDLVTDGPSVSITWAETGGPPTSAPTGKTGFGSRLLRMSVESQLSGAFEQEWLPTGLCVKLTIPKASLDN